MMAIKSEPCESSQPNCDRTTCKKSEVLQDLSNKGRAKASELLTCIRKGQYDQFVDLLESKPRADLNAFFDGNTALHHCLLMRKYLFCQVFLNDVMTDAYESMNRT